MGGLQSYFRTRYIQAFLQKTAGRSLFQSAHFHAMRMIGVSIAGNGNPARSLRETDSIAIVDPDRSTSATGVVERKRSVHERISFCQ
jgi:hypothetical protein